jgi:hypothetical protein
LLRPSPPQVRCITEQNELAREVMHQSNALEYQEGHTPPGSVQSLMLQRFRAALERKKGAMIITGAVLQVRLAERGSAAGA